MESFRFYYSFLSPLEKKVYNGIADSISKYETNIRVMGTAGQVKKILPMVWKDNPQFFYVDTTQYSITSAGVVCCINLNFHKNRAEIRSLTPRLEQLGSRFLEEVRRKR